MLAGCGCPCWLCLVGYARLVSMNPEGDNVRVPDRLLCSISKEVYRDPVFTDRGNTYERRSIEDWWKHRHQPLDPLSNEDCRSRHLIINWDKRRDVQEFLDAHPTFLPHGWDTRALRAPIDEEVAVPRSAQTGRRHIRICCFMVVLALVLPISVTTPTEQNASLFLLHEAAHHLVLSVMLLPPAVMALRGLVPRSAINAILDSMRAYPEHIGVQRSACRALGYLESSAPGAESRIQAVRSLIIAMSVHHQHAIIQEEAAWALEVMTASDVSGIRSTVFEAEGIKAVVRSAEAFPAHIGIQLSMCCILSRLAGDVGFGDKTSQLVIPRAGGIDAIVLAMKTSMDHSGPQTSSLQAAACSALANIAFNSAENQEAVARSGGIQAIAAAMWAHPDHLGVQANGCLAFGNVAAFNIAALQVAVARAGGISAIAVAMNTHPQDTGVQEYACSALSNLAYKSEANAALMIEQGIIEAALEAQRMHRDDEAVQKETALILRILSDSAPGLSSARTISGVPT